MHKVKRSVADTLLAAAFVMGSSGLAQAATVYYKGSAVAWNYGRSWAVYSQSDVQSNSYEHHSTANTTPSGWKKPGVLASAMQWVGTGAATAYWSCRG
jgi:hypothetical protein